MSFQLLCVASASINDSRKRDSLARISNAVSRSFFFALNLADASVFLRRLSSSISACPAPNCLNFFAPEIRSSGDPSTDSSTDSEIDTRGAPEARISRALARDEGRLKEVDASFVRFATNASRVAVSVGLAGAVLDSAMGESSLRGSGTAPKFLNNSSAVEKLPERGFLIGRKGGRRRKRFEKIEGFEMVGNIKRHDASMLAINL